MIASLDYDPRETEIDPQVKRKFSLLLVDKTYVSFHHVNSFLSKVCHQCDPPEKHLKIITYRTVTLFNYTNKFHERAYNEERTSFIWREGTSSPRISQSQTRQTGVNFESSGSAKQRVEPATFSQTERNEFISAIVRGTIPSSTKLRASLCESETKVKLARTRRGKLLPLAASSPPCFRDSAVDQTTVLPFDFPHFIPPPSRYRHRYFPSFLFHIRVIIRRRGDEMDLYARRMFT